ncbi:MAG: hypothetical protein Q8P31_01940 [Bacillota bacterium]|nr:hypothetical protein [Bacillota bacterium]
MSCARANTHDVSIQTEPSRPRRSYRARPLRLIAALAVVGAVVWALGWAHARPYVAASWPARDPLGARGWGGLSLQQVTEASLDGRCLAVNAAPGGPAAAVSTGGGSTSLTLLWPDGRRSATSLTLPGEPALAVFVADLTLMLWVPDADRAAGGVLSAVSVSAAGQSKTKIGTAWQARIPNAVFGLVALDTAVAVIAGGQEGVPHTCLVVSAGSGKTLWQVSLADGLFTSWGGATPAGGLALAGAEFDGTGVSPFARLYSASGKLLCDLRTEEGPAYLVQPSPTGRYVLVVTWSRLRLVDGDGTILWSAAFPAVRVEGALVTAAGRVVISTVRNTLALDQSGRVQSRWKNPGLSATAVGAGGDTMALGLMDGVALLDGAGRLRASLTLTGVSGALGVDAQGAFLCRTEGSTLALFVLIGGSSR